MNHATLAKQPGFIPDLLSRWKGAKLIPSLGLMLLGAALWQIAPPEGLNIQAWHLFIIFLCTIIGVIVKPLPMGGVAIIALAFCNITNTLTLEQSLSSFSSKVVWLVIFAFLIARGFIKTGLGTRVAYYFVALFGKSTLGLSYSITATEFVLSPAVPSNTARGAGVIFPIVRSLVTEFGSCPSDGTQKKMGAFLIMVCFQANVITSCMFLTALAGNPLIASFAAEAGVEITWISWAVATIVPGLVSLILIPLVIYVIYPPEVKHTPEASNMAKKNLKEMGAPSTDEWLMMGTFGLLLVLWIFGGQLGVDATTAALIGFSILLFTGVLKWDDVLNETSAWGTLIWFATLLMMANYLTKFGMISWFSGNMQESVSSLDWLFALGFLALVYYFTHYFFASVTAHITSMYSAFLVVMIAAGAPPMVAAMTLAVFSSLSGGLTHYGTGPAPVYFGAGYVDIKAWWKNGLIVGLVNILIWAVVGSIWWKVIGLW